MALKDIINEILKEKEEKIKEIEREKERERKEIEKKYQKELEKRKREILEKKREEFEREILAQKEKLERKREILILKEKKGKLDEIYNQFFEQLKNLKGEKEKKILEKLIEKVFLEIKDIPEKEIEILAVSKKENLLREILREKGKENLLSLKSIEGSFGFLVKTKKFDIDCTLESLFEITKANTQTFVAKILFE